MTDDDLLADLTAPSTMRVLVCAALPYCHLARHDRASLAHKYPHRFRYHRATPVRDTWKREKAFAEVLEVIDFNDFVWPEAPSEA